MRNKFFKFNENYAKVIKHLDDKQAGQYVKANSDYAFEGKTYAGKDAAVKTTVGTPPKKILFTYKGKFYPFYDRWQESS